MKMYLRASDRRDPVEDPVRAGVGFVDVLFALVVGKILELSVSEGRLPTAGKAQLVLAALATVSSWVGYHNSLNRTRYFLRPFWNLPFFQFAVDVLLVYTYWLLAVTAEKPTVVKEAPTALPEAVVFVAIFALYVVWDLLALWIRNSPHYSARPLGRDVRERRVVSLLALSLSIVMAAVVAAKDPSRTVTVVTVDALLAALVVAYRIGKEAVTPPDASSPRSDGHGDEP